MATSGPSQDQTRAGPGSPGSATRLIGALSILGSDGRTRSMTLGELEEWPDHAGLRRGDQVGDYRLGELLASGGMGEVWQARDLRLGREVALKFMLRRSKRGLSRFAREAQVVAALDHPNIAKIYAFSADPPFLAMQLVQAQPITGIGLSSIRALRDASRAIDHAHQRGVLHRDVKPGNILVDAQGTATVVDFGLATILQRDGTERHSITISGEIVGTPAFMAPEQARGDSGSITVRTDVYGLGATLHCLLRGGEPPFDGATAFDVIEAVLEDEPPPTQGNRDLETIADKAMAKDPLKRYASAGEFADDLDRFLRHEPIQARRPGAWDRLVRSVQRNPSIWGLSIALAIAIVVATSIGVAQFLAVQEEQRQRLREREAAAAAREDAAQRQIELAREREVAAVAAESAVRNQERAVAAEQERLQTLALQQFVEEMRRLLREHDDEVARGVDPERDPVTVQRDLDQRLDGLIARIDGQCAQQQWRHEGVLRVLLGDARYLRQDDAGACAAYREALALSAAPLSARMDVATAARLGHARSLVRGSFLDYPVQRQLFRSDGDDRITAARLAMAEDLQAIGVAGVNRYEVDMLTLWKVYLDEIEEPSAELRASVARLASAGGRRNELLLLLQGILVGSYDPDADDLVEAARLYDAAIDKYHALPQAYLLRAIARFGLGEYEAAEADTTEAIIRRPAYALAYLLRGRIRSARGDRDGAAGDLRNTVVLADHEPMAWYHHGLMALQQGAIERAAEDFMKAQEVAKQTVPFDADDQIWYAIGRIYDSMAMPEHAITAYGEAADHGSAEALAAHLELLGRLGDRPAADSLLDEALIRFPGAHAGLLVTRARLRQEVGDLEGARLDLDRALASAPADPWLRLQRGRLAWAQHRWNEARLDLDAAAAWCSDHELQVGGHDQGSSELRDLASEVQRTLTGLYRDMGETDAAWRALRLAGERAEGLQAARVQVMAARLHGDIGGGRESANTLADARQRFEHAARLALEHGDLLRVEAIVKEARRLLEEERFGQSILREVGLLRARVRGSLEALWLGH